MPSGVWVWKKFHPILNQILMLIRSTTLRFLGRRYWKQSRISFEVGENDLTAKKRQTWPKNRVVEIRSLKVWKKECGQKDWGAEHKLVFVSFRRLALYKILRFFFSHYWIQMPSNFKNLSYRYACTKCLFITALLIRPKFLNYPSMREWV